MGQGLRQLGLKSDCLVVSVTILSLVLFAASALFSSLSPAASPHAHGPHDRLGRGPSGGLGGQTHLD